MKLSKKIILKFLIVFAIHIIMISCNSQGEKNLVETEKENSDQAVDSFSILYSVGNEKLSNGSFNEAIPVFSRAILLNPGNPDPYYCRGYALSAIGKDSVAIIDFNNAIKLKPDYKGAYFSRGVSYSVTRRYNEAISDYDKVLELDPVFSNAWYNKGLIKLNIGLKNEGLKDIKRAADLNDPKALQFFK